MGPEFKELFILYYEFDRSETVRDRAKMNLAGHRVRRLFGNYFEPWSITKKGCKYLLFDC